MNCSSGVDSLDTSVFTQSGLHVPGLIAIVVFYGAMFALGMLPTFCSKSTGSGDNDTGPIGIMLAGRKMNSFIGLLTLTGNLELSLHIGERLENVIIYFEIYIYLL